MRAAISGLLLVLLVIGGGALWAADPSEPDSKEVLRGLRAFYQKTARADGSFQNGIDPEYLGMSDSAYSDMAAVTYAVTIHKTFGWELPHQERTIEWLLARQQENGDFINVAGTVDPKSPQGRVYNTTQALVALHALGVKPKYDPLPVFEEILKQDYKTLPAYSTSFFPLAYLCAGRPIPEQADRAIRALMVPDEDGYLNDHVAATFHSSHYYALVGEPTPRGKQMVSRILRDQARDGSWLINPFARDRHATFDAVFTLKHEASGDAHSRQAMQRAGDWALRCRNDDGGFGHYPGSTSDADANYFQVGTLVMTGYLKPVDPLPEHPELLSWGHLMPVQQPRAKAPRRYTTGGWVGGLAFSQDGKQLAIGSSDGRVVVKDLATGMDHEWELDRVPINGVALSADGRSLVVGTHDPMATLLNRDQRTSAPLSLKGHAGSVTSVAFSPTDNLIATASIDGTIRLWNRQGKHQKTLSGHKSWVNAVAFLDGKSLVSGSSDGTVRVWSVDRDEPTKILAATKAEVRSLAVSADGNYVAAGIRYGLTKVWDTSRWREIQLEQTADDVWTVLFTPAGQLVTAAGQWNRPTEIVFWDLSTQKPVRRLQHTGEVLALALSADGSQLAAGGGDNAVSVWRLKEAQATR